MRAEVRVDRVGMPRVASAAIRARRITAHLPPFDAASAAARPPKKASDKGPPKVQRGTPARTFGVRATLRVDPENPWGEREREMELLDVVQNDVSAMSQAAHFGTGAINVLGALNSDSVAEVCAEERHRGEARKNRKKSKFDRCADGLLRGATGALPLRTDPLADAIASEVAEVLGAPPLRASASEVSQCDICLST